MEVSEKMRDEVVLHSWKMMKLDRCRVAWGTFENFRFPNGITVTIRIALGGRPIKVKSTVEQAREVESVMSGRDYRMKAKKEKIEFSVQYSSRGDYLDLLWDLYSAGSDWAF